MKTIINRTMKRSAYKPGILLTCLAVLLSFSLGAQEVSKEYHKEYKADKNTTLDISNRYGDVLITAWDKDQVVIDVKVTVSHSDKSKAEKYLGMIDVQFSESANTISAKTVIEDNFNFSGWGSNREFKINYTVKMPYSTNLTLANRYGNTDIDELRGLVNLDIKYGGIEVDKLTRGNEKPINKLVIAYSKGNIAEAGWLDINIRYTNTLTVEKSQALLIDSRYSKLKIGETSSIVGDAKYDTYNVDKINNLVLMSGYTTVNVGTLTKKLNHEGSYGSMTVDQIPAGFESIDVSVRYSSVRLGIAENANYRLDGRSSYGGIKLNEDNFNFQKKIIENTSSEISGVVGKESSPAATVKLSTSYGTIKLY
jgi:hypothetical protein